MKGEAAGSSETSVTPVVNQKTLMSRKPMMDSPVMNQSLSHISVLAAVFESCEVLSLLRYAVASEI